MAHGCRRTRCTLAALGCISLLLAACSGGGTSGGDSTSAGQTGTTNTSPSITGSPGTTATVAKEYSFQALAYDAEGNALTFSAVGLPGWSTLDSQTGWLHGTPGDTDAGESADIIVSVSDGKSSTALAPFSVEIAAQPGANDSTPGTAAPTISGSPPQALAADTAYTFTPVASDADTLTLTYAISNKPSWASFSTSTGTLAGTPGIAMVGSYQGIVIGVSDGMRSVALPAFSIAVVGYTAGINYAPSISGTPSSSDIAGLPYDFIPSASDPNGDPMTFSITGVPAWATFSVVTGELSGIPAVAQIGDYGNIAITVSDGRLSSSLPAFSIAVTPVASGSVLITWIAPTENTDGSPLTDLAGYYIYYRAGSASLTTAIKLNNAGLTYYLLSDLASVDTDFAMTAYSVTGAQSPSSGVVHVVGAAI